MCIRSRRTSSRLIPSLCAALLTFGSSTSKAACDYQTQKSDVETLLRAKDYGRAAVQLGTLKACPDLSPLQLFEIGWLYGRARHFAEAVATFRLVPQDVPDQQTHRYAVALANFEVADYSVAITELKALQNENLLSPEAANLLAVSYSKLHRYNDAEAVLRNEISKTPSDQNAYLNLVTLYADQSKLADAAQTATRATENFPQSPAVFVVRGAANTLLGHLPDAHRDFETAITLAPREADPQFFLALTDYKQGKFAVASDSLRKAIASGIADSDLHYLLAECLLKIEGSDKKVVAAELDEAIRLNPDSVSARALRGRLLLESGQPEKALADLQHAHERDAGSRTATYNLARTYRALGKTEEANRLFAQFREHSIDSIDEYGNRKLNDALSESSLEP